MNKVSRSDGAALIGTAWELRPDHQVMRLSERGSEAEKG